jgi:hypothetical protein
MWEIINKIIHVTRLGICHRAVANLGSMYDDDFSVANIVCVMGLECCQSNRATIKKVSLLDSFHLST